MTGHTTTHITSQLLCVPQKDWVRMEWSHCDTHHTVVAVGATKGLGTHGFVTERYTPLRSCCGWYEGTDRERNGQNTTHIMLQLAWVR